MTFEGCHQHIGWRNLKDAIILEFCDLILGLLLLLSELILGLNGTRAVLADSNLVLLESCVRGWAITREPRIMVTGSLLSTLTL